MSKKYGLILMWMLLALLPAGSASSQDFQKHPRVAELEEKLTADAFNYVRGRFPGMPVLITVRIDPLRRINDRTIGGGEPLPYTPLSNSEIADEWDDVQRSLHELMPRVRSATLSITLPHTVTDPEMMETREALFTSLNLIPARDKIDFTRKQWTTDPPADLRWLEVGVFAAGALLIVGALIIGMRSAAAKVSSGLKASQGSGASMPAMPMSAGIVNNHGGAGKAAPSVGGDVRFNDPIKIKQQLKIAIETLSEDPSFPTLEDMVAFDQKANEDPALLGAVISEFPQFAREKIFVYCHGKNWLEAFASPGDLNLAAYEFLNRIARRDRQFSVPTWHQMLLAVWRLDDLMPDFLRSFGPQIGLHILAHMPTSVSIPMGKRAFPGAWGVLLAPEARLEPLVIEISDKVKLAAITLKPLNELTLLEAYRHEKGLLDFLKLAEPKDEQEVYEASRDDAVIRRLRPPFYPVFSASEEDLRSLVPNFSVEEWAMALFNVPRKDRRTIESLMSDKQRYMLIETLKMLDQNQPDRQAVGNARESIARRMNLSRSREGLKLETVIKVQSDEPREDDSANAAA